MFDKRDEVVEMAFMTEVEFEKKLKKIQEENIQKERLKQLKDERNKSKPAKKPASTSKVILWAVSIMCLEIIIFCEYIMVALQDTSAMYVLIGVPVSLIPVVLGYYYKAKAENTAGGITYETAMAQMIEPITDTGNSVG